MSVNEWCYLFWPFLGKFGGEPGQDRVVLRAELSSAAARISSGGQEAGQKDTRRGLVGIELDLPAHI